MHTELQLTEVNYIESDKARRKRQVSVNNVSRLLDLSTLGFYFYINKVEL